MESPRAREHWEQELRLRQRSVVFPDTVRNEGNFFRGIVYNRARLNGVQRMGAGLFGATFLFTASLFASQVIGAVVEGPSLFWTLSSVGTGLMSLLFFAVAFKLLFVAILPGKPTEERDE